MQVWLFHANVPRPADTLAAPEAEVQRVVWAVAGVFVATAVLSSALLIRGHLRHFTQPTVQSKVRAAASLRHAFVHAHVSYSFIQSTILF